MSESREQGWYWCQDSYGDFTPLFWDGSDWMTTGRYAGDTEYFKVVLAVREKIEYPGGDA